MRARWTVLLPAELRSPGRGKRSCRTRERQRGGQKPNRSGNKREWREQGGGRSKWEENGLGGEHADWVRRWNRTRRRGQHYRFRRCRGRARSGSPPSATLISITGWLSGVHVHTHTHIDSRSTSVLCTLLFLRLTPSVTGAGLRPAYVVPASGQYRVISSCCRNPGDEIVNRHWTSVTANCWTNAVRWCYRRLHSRCRVLSSIGNRHRFRSCYEKIVDPIYQTGSLCEKTGAFNLMWNCDKITGVLEWNWSKWLD